MGLIKKSLILVNFQSSLANVNRTQMKFFVKRMGHLSWEIDHYRFLRLICKLDGSFWLFNGYLGQQTLNLELLHSLHLKLCLQTVSLRNITHCFSVNTMKNCWKLTLKYNNKKTHRILQVWLQTKESMLTANERVCRWYVCTSSEKLTCYLNNYVVWLRCQKCFPLIEIPKS